MRHVVVVRRKLCFDAGDREEAADANIEAFFYWEIKIQVFENRIEAILTVKQQQLLAEVTFRRREAVVDSIEPGEMKSPVEVRVLHRVGQAFDIDDGLIEFYLVWEDVVRHRKVIVARRTEVNARSDPPIDLGSAVLKFECRHQGVSISVWCTDVG